MKIFIYKGGIQMLTNPEHFSFEEKKFNLESITSIHDLVEFVSQIINNPVTIEASNFELIAYCRNVQTLDLARQGTILSKKVPDNIVSYLTDYGIVQTIENSNEAISIPANDEIGLSQRVVCVIKHRQKVLGHIWVQETNHILTKEERKFLEDVAKRAAILISDIERQKEIKTQTLDLYYTKLIQGYFSNERQARLEGELIGFQKPERFCLIMFQSKEADFNSSFLSTLRFYSIYASKSTYFFINGNQVFVIVGSPSNIQGSSITLAQDMITNITTKYENPDDLFIALSKEYEQMIDLKKCYQEATTVLNLVNKFKMKIPYKYDDLGFYKLLPVIQQYYDEENYQNEKLQKLQNYDLLNNTDLFNTLLVYLQCNCKIKEAADSLYIHPNTLNYRLKRISEICSINFEDLHERIKFYIDILIMNHLMDK